LNKNITFLFPGQGSQQASMGLELYQTYGVARALFKVADESLDFPLSRLCFEGPKEELNGDLNAQLAVYTVSCITADLLKNYRVSPRVVSGYSSGFYAAAYAAGCFSFADGLFIVKRAGEILLEEGQKMRGAMAIIFGLSLDNVNAMCNDIGNVHVAIVNTPRQIIISGLQSSVAEVIKRSQMEGGALDARLIPAACAYHTPFMEEGRLRLLREIDHIDFNEPKMRLIAYHKLNTVDTGENLKKTMAEQLVSPVLWADVIRRICEQHRGIFIEIGPGTVICRTVRWIDRSIEVIPTDTGESLLNAVDRCVGSVHDK
jgi:[acyl-carrier-protein] S-malonyltransferase